MTASKRLEPEQAGWQSFGRWLRLKRKALDLTHEGLGARAGYSAATIRKVEAEERRPSAELVDQLADIFGIPASEREAFLRFARGDWRSAPAATRARGSWNEKLPHSQLPGTTTALIGREGDVAAVLDHITEPDIRLLTLVGPPGIGKTRLSLEVARAASDAFADGVFFAALAPLAEPEQIATAMMNALGLVSGRDERVREQLQAGIGDRQLLLVLDNAEHLIEAVAELVADRLAACPQLKVLVTSRESLRVPGEWLYPLPPLAFPQEIQNVPEDMLADFSALRLFAERARAVQPGFALTRENAAAVAAICRELDGLPLAIELIAARSRLLSPAELLARLDSGFALSADGRRGVPARQKSLQEAIAWSYDLLPLAERKLFDGLSVFAGGFTLDAAEGVFGSEIDGQPTAILLTSLLDKSLVQRITGRHIEPRLLMLATIRQFAVERLRERGEEAAARGQHLAHYLALAERASAAMAGPDQATWLSEVDVEHDNFRAALEWALADGRVEETMRLLDAIAWPWLLLRGLSAEVAGWLAQARALPGSDQHPALYARLHNHSGLQQWLAGDYGAASASLEEGLALAGELGEAGAGIRADALIYQGMVEQSRGGDSRLASRLLEQGWQLHERYGNYRGVALAVLNMGWVAEGRQDEDEAVVLYKRSLELAREQGDLWGMGRSAESLGNLFLRQGRLDIARVYLDQQRVIDEALQFKHGMVLALQHLGDLSRCEQRLDEADSYYQQSVALSRRYGLKATESKGWYYYGMTALQQEQYPLARNHFAAYLRATAAGSGAAEALAGLAAAAAELGEPAMAARLSGAARQVGGYRFPAFDQAEFDRHLNRARTQLGEERFAALFEEGRRMALDHALAYALEGAGDNDQ